MTDAEVYDRDNNNNNMNSKWKIYNKSKVKAWVGRN
jgi:hypothetical protein